MTDVPPSAPPPAPDPDPDTGADRAPGEPVEVILGIGGNVGDAEATCRAALDAVEAHPMMRVRAASSFYATPPWGYEAQAWFVNLCAAVETSLAPRALLAALKGIEAGLGRRDTFRWGPRVVDLDIVAYDDRRIDDPELVVPHREALRRAFVLVPLAEIRPDLVLAGERVAEAAARFADEPIRVVAPPWRPEGGGA